MLISCPECGKEISDRAPTCPYCGSPIRSPDESSSINQATSVGGACPHCGQILHSDSTFCPFCGRSVRRADKWAKASLFKRFVAFVIDGGLPWAILVMGSWNQFSVLIPRVVLPLIALIVIQLLLMAGGRTLGKAILGVRVVDKFTEQPVGLGRMLFRSLASILSGAVLGIGYLSGLWDRDGQTWHDKMVNTVVVTPVFGGPDVRLGNTSDSRA